jgi:NAD+ diphosphatase
MMTPFPAPGFTGSPLLRFNHERDDPALFDEQLSSLSARLLRLDGLTPGIEEDGTLAWGSMAEADPDAPLALLGIIDGKPRFVELKAIAENGAQRTAIITTALSQLQAGEAATYSVARCLVDWHSRHNFCARCGRLTQPFRSGWVRLCDRETGGCGTEHFPRTDPVVIMLAEHHDRVLVGRQPSWPPGRYSALAGFVEVGESIEEAVARELYEEAGVVTTDVRYIASQPWPFPSQLMIACIATAESAAIELDAIEIQDAIWVDRDEVAASLRNDAGARFLSPPPFAIANTLLSRWVAGA